MRCARMERHRARSGVYLKAERIFHELLQHSRCNSRAWHAASADESDLKSALFFVPLYAGQVSRRKGASTRGLICRCAAESPPLESLRR